MEEKKNLNIMVMAIVMMSAFIAPFMANAVNIAIPAIGQEFSGNQIWLNWIVSSNLIASAAFLLSFGRLADQYGRKKIFLIGTVLLALSSLACALATSLQALVYFRIAQGIASAMIFGNSMAILNSVIPPQIRGKALGLTSAATYTGLSAGPVLGGFICSVFDWRGIFYFNFIVSLVIMVLTLWKLKGEWTGNVQRFDSWGSVLCIAGQALLLFGLSDLMAGSVYQLSFLAGIILTVWFVRYELRTPHPLVPIAAFIKNKPFAYANLATLINYSATFALGFILSLYLQAVLGYSTSVSGLVLISQPILMALLSPLAGSLSDRIQPRLLAAAGMGISALGLFFFIFLGKESSLVLIILNLAFIGLGFAFFASPNTNAVMSAVDRSFYGLASSILGNMRLLGQSFSMAIVSLITSVLMRDMTLSSPGYVDQLMITLRISFIIFAVLCALGVLVSLGKKESRQTTGSET